MANKLQQRQKFIRYYKEHTGDTLVDMHKVADFAAKMGWPMPVPPDPRDLLAKQFSEAAREEIRHDKQTKRPYRASLTMTNRLRDGRQQTLWMDVDEATRPQMVKGLNNYRDQMVGEAVIATDTADHWNRSHPDQRQLDFVKDFTDDVNERRNSGRKAS